MLLFVVYLSDNSCNIYTASQEYNFYKIFLPSAYKETTSTATAASESAATYVEIHLRELTLSHFYFPGKSKENHPSVSLWHSISMSLCLLKKAGRNNGNISWIFHTEISSKLITG
jgi:hypothetical protein